MKLITVEEVADIARRANRILVIGCSGSGKSTLSQRLCRRFDLPYISMDKEFFWLPGWQMRDRDSIARLVGEAVLQSRWLMDGTNPRTMPIRLARTDLAIWMRPPRWRSLLGVFVRVIRSHGKVRPEMADGCNEKVDLEFLRYIWTFERHQLPRIDAQFAEHGQHVPVLMLKSHRETVRLLEILARGN